LRIDEKTFFVKNVLRCPRRSWMQGYMVNMCFLCFILAVGVIAGLTGNLFLFLVTNSCEFCF
ncbi:MAG: hypothetical protein LBE36_08650, partial [Flavobacteriaceae bacterium]|nr:hypothetical protein [Flavobacteriaceae bacterium]